MLGDNNKLSEFDVVKVLQESKMETCNNEMDKSLGSSMEDITTSPALVS